MSGKTSHTDVARVRFTNADAATRAVRNRRLIGALALLALAIQAPTKASDAHHEMASPCSTARCGLLVDGAYPNLVIGRLAHVATPSNLQQTFEWAKAHGYWKQLPSRLKPYLRDVQQVTLEVKQGAVTHPVTLFMLHTEYAAAPYRVGDLVRYAPHDAAHDEAATGTADDLALFHGLTGCVATLCEKGDRACFARYRQGAFNPVHGQQVSLTSGKAMSPGVRIDPISLLPVR